MAEQVEIQTSPDQTTPPPITKASSPKRSQSGKISRVDAFLTQRLYSAEIERGLHPRDPDAAAVFSARSLIAYPNAAYQFVNGIHLSVDTRKGGTGPLSDYPYVTTDVVSHVYRQETDEDIYYDLYLKLRDDSRYRIPDVITKAEVIRYELQITSILLKIAIVQMNRGLARSGHPVMEDIQRAMRSFWRADWEVDPTDPESNDVVDADSEMMQLMASVKGWKMLPGILGDLIWLFTPRALGKGNYSPVVAFMVPRTKTISRQGGEGGIRQGEFANIYDRPPSVSTVKKEWIAFHANPVNREISRFFGRLEYAVDASSFLVAPMEAPPTADAEWLNLWINGGVSVLNPTDPELSTVIPNAGTADPDTRFRVPVWSVDKLTPRFEAWFAHGFGGSKEDSVVWPLLNNWGVGGKIVPATQLPLMVYLSKDMRSDPVWTKFPTSTEGLSPNIDMTRGSDPLVGYDMLMAQSLDNFRFGWRLQLQRPSGIGRENFEVGMMPTSGMLGRPMWGDSLQIRDGAKQYFRAKWGLPA